MRYAVWLVLGGVLASPSPSGGRPDAPRDQLPADQRGFDRLWAVHPGTSQDSADILAAHGLPDYMENTCAIRFSIMLNNASLTITPAKTRAAGIARTPYYSAKTKQYYILSAREMWIYLSRYFRAADRVFPGSGRYGDPAEFQRYFDSAIKPLISRRKGIVAFEKIFSYEGTGHVDLFDGETLSDSFLWYPCTRLHVWYVIVP